jgi:hypothetical protein
LLPALGLSIGFAPAVKGSPALPGALGLSVGASADLAGSEDNVIPGTWHKIAVSFSTVSDPTSQHDITLFTMAAKETLMDAGVMCTTTFRGGANTGCTISIGFAGSAGSPASNVSAYFNGKDVYTAVDPIPAFSELPGPEAADCRNTSSSWTITLRANSQSGNLNALTQGSLTVWLLTSVLP